MVYLLIITGMVAFVVLLSRIIIASAEKMVSHLVERTHREAEVILETGLVPASWGRKGPVRFTGGALSKFLALRKLDRIIRFYRYSPLAEDGDSRKLHLGRLQDIRAGWQKMEWNEIYPYQR